MSELHPRRKVSQQDLLQLEAEPAWQALLEDLRARRQDLLAKLTERIPVTDQERVSAAIDLGRKQAIEDVLVWIDRQLGRPSRP